MTTSAPRGFWATPRLSEFDGRLQRTMALFFAGRQYASFRRAVTQRPRSLTEDTVVHGTPSVEVLRPSRRGRSVPSNSAQKSRRRTRAAGTIVEAVAEVWHHRQLLFILAWRDIKIRYKQSVMGFLWALLMPTMIVTAGILVRAAFAMASGGTLNLTDVSSVATKAVPWAFFVGSIRFATGSLIANTDLVTKIYFPREVFPIAAVLAGLFDFAVASTVLVVVLAVAKTGISVQVLWVPALIVVLVAFTTGCGLLLSCANLFFRDVKYLVEVFLTFGIFFTPVFYEVKMFGRWANWLLINPLAPILEGLNDTVVRHQPPPMAWLGYSAAIAVVVLLGSWIIFDKAEPAFAANI